MNRHRGLKDYWAKSQDILLLKNWPNEGEIKLLSGNFI